MIKKQIRVTIKLTDETRFLLANAGYIDYKTGVSKQYGKLSKLINNLTAKYLNDPRNRFGFTFHELLRLQNERDRLNEKIQKYANDLAQLKNLKQN